MRVPPADLRRVQTRKNLDYPDPPPRGVPKAAHHPGAQHKVLQARLFNDRFLLSITPWTKENMKPIEKARQVLDQLPRCGAKSRQTRLPCRLPALGAGGRCRFHGGRSTGRPPIHGRNTRKAMLARDWARLLLGVIVAQQGGTLRFFKPGRMTEERVAQVLQLKGGL